MGSAIFCLILGLFVLMTGVRLGLKVDLRIGPGFFPFVAGILLAFLSIVLFVQSLTETKTGQQKRSFWSKEHGWVFVFLTLVGIGTYILVLNYLGFLLSTFLLLFFLFTVIGGLKWWKAALSGTIAAAAVYLVFEIWLRANLPRGFFSF
ncbi:MAG: hypothetical protein A2156_00625 [Deltaproteobacteria bacterium RBG_16_48_10]|nr:MAG: hypothetical protein A2156_00625 [Deltaproteobacteria bacterium RBG_16_48_10]